MGKKCTESLCRTVSGFADQSLSWRNLNKSLDLRGLVSAVKATRSGLSPIDAIQMGIINKSFDVFEKEIVEDVVSTRIPSSWTGKDIWG